MILDEVLILYLVVLRAPGFEGGERFVAQQGVGREMPLGAGECELVVNERVIEAVLCRVGLGAGEVDPFQTRPIDGSEAHRARLAGCINLAAAQIEGAEGTGSTTNGADLRVSRRVIVGSDSVGAGCDDFSVACYDRSEWSAAVSDVLHRESYRLAHEFFVVHIVYFTRPSANFTFAKVSKIFDKITRKVPYLDEWITPRPLRQESSEIFRTLR